MQKTIVGRVRHVITVTEELIALAAEENRRLSVGRPVDLQDIVARKRKLTRDMEAWLKFTTAHPEVLRTVPPQLNAKLSGLTRELAQALGENTAMLTRALVTMRRRTETIVRAIRETRTLPAGYGGNGWQQTLSPYPVSISSGVDA